LAKNKARKRKQVLKKPSKIPKLDTYSLLFIITFILMSIFFFINFSELTDITNKYIKNQASWIMISQIIIYLILMGGFAYFGYHYLSERKIEKIDVILISGILCLIILIHIFAFNQALSTNGDNARYMIYAKSLIETGGFTRIYLPTDSPVIADPVGLSLILSPMYLIFGMNIISMKLLVFLCFIGSLILTYAVFKQFVDMRIAIIITILFGSHPYIVHFSSMVMTEIPFIFWSLLSLWILLKYEQSDKIHIGYLIFATAAIFMTYFTRAIGAGFTVAVFFYFLVKINWPLYIKNKDFSFLKTLEFKKFAFICLSLFIVFGGWQLRSQITGGTSQAQLFANLNIIDNVLTKSLPDFWQVFAQNIFADQMIRWNYEAVELKWALVAIIAMVGLFYSLYRKEIVAYYSFFVLFILILGYRSLSPLVFSRYLIPFTPFLIYFFYTGIRFAFSLFKKENLNKLGIFAGSIALYLILMSNLSGTSYIIEKAHRGAVYPIAEANYIECARWAEENLPPDAIVTSRKEAFFYIFSGLRGFKHTTSYMRYSKEWEAERLETFKKNNTSYLILDTFNSTTIRNIVPIIRNHPEKLKLIKRIGEENKGACYLFEIQKWW